jgi:hypothetical protein
MNPMFSSVTDRWRSFTCSVSIRAATTNVAWVAGERIADIVFGTLINIFVTPCLGRVSKEAFKMQLAEILPFPALLKIDVYRES